MFSLKFLKIYLLIDRTYIDSKVLCFYNDSVYELIRCERSNKIKLRKYVKDLKDLELLKVKSFYDIIIDDKKDPYFYYLPRNKDIEHMKEDDIKSFYIISNVSCQSIDNIEKYYLAYCKDSINIIPFLADNIDDSKYKDDAYLLKRNYRSMINNLLVYENNLTVEENTDRFAKKIILTTHLVDSASLLLWSSYILLITTKDKYIYNIFLKYYTLNKLKCINKKK